MIFTNFDSTDVYLITAPHDWSRSGPRLEGHYASTGARTLTGLEVRRPRALFWRFAQVSEHVIANRAVPAFRAAVAGRRAQPILMPCWGLGADYQNGLLPGLTAPLQLVIDHDSDTWEIIEDGEVPVMATDERTKLYPLLWGDFTEDPDPMCDGGRVSSVSIRFVEKGRVDYALSFTAAFATTLATATRPDPKLFPFVADWSKPVRSGKATVDVFESTFAKQRDTLKTIYPQLTAREYRMGFQLFDSDVVDLLAFVQQMQGINHSFWLPTYVDEANVLAVAGADVTLDNASVIPDYVALFDRSAVYPRKVLSVADDVITLSSEVAGLNFDEATICGLYMCRLASPTIKLSFNSETAVELDLRFIETPNEIDLPAGETYGTTTGGLPFEVYLFEYTVDALDNVQQWHYTDHALEIAWSGETWLPDLIEVQGLAQDDTLDLDNVTLKGRVVASHPFNLFVPWTLESPLQLTIYRAQLDAAGALVGVPAAVTRGEVTIHSLRGELVEAELVPHRRLLDRRAPSWLIQRECNYAVFSGPCGLARAAWEFTGELLEYIGGSAVKLRLDNVARTSGVPLPSVPLNYFAGGWIQVGSGGAFQWRHVVECANVEGTVDDVDITLAYPFNSVYSSGQEFKLFPGCSGAVAVCADKFGNSLNFGGCPHVPESNPALREQQRSPTKTGGKK